MGASPGSRFGSIYMTAPDYRSCFSVITIIKTLVALAILCLLLELAGCTAVTRFESTSLRYTSGSETTETGCADLTVYMPFINHYETHTVVPGLYNHELGGEPYRFAYNLNGDFDELVDITVTAQGDGVSPHQLPVTLGMLTRAKRGDRGARTKYAAAWTHPDAVYAPAKRQAGLSITSKLVLRRDGVAHHCTVSQSYRYFHSRRYINKFLSKMMSI